MQEINMGIVMNSFEFHEPEKSDFFGVFDLSNKAEY